jgi:predicted anti-sigma-YlaC factor YlaD
MKCSDVSKDLIGYLDRRANSAERREVEEHLTACPSCRMRAEELRKVWTVLDEVPLVEPSLGFDARLRQRIAAEPRLRWFRWFVPQPRLAFSMALLLALSVWMVKLPRENTGIRPMSAAQTEQEDFSAIKDLGVLENYDVVTKFDALSELVPASDQQPEQPRQDKPSTND